MLGSSVIASISAVLFKFSSVVFVVVPNPILLVVSFPAIGVFSTYLKCWMLPPIISFLIIGESVNV